jgi:hypothetical protein
VELMEMDQRMSKTRLGWLRFLPAKPCSTNIISDLTDNDEALNLQRIAAAVRVTSKQTCARSLGPR